MTVPLLPIAPETSIRLAGSPLLVMLDVDGTLAPLAPRPQDAVVPAETRRIISGLVARPNVHVVLVSGRGAADARRLVAVANTWVVGNHGFEIVSPDGREIIDPGLESLPPVIAEAHARLRPLVGDIPGVILEQKRWALSVHYRLADPAAVPSLRSTVEETARALGLRTQDGKMLIEVRPEALVDKGSAVVALIAPLGGATDDASVLFAGDDVTDEDAFRALREWSTRPVTIRVGEEEAASSAEFGVCDTDEIRAFLEWLLATRAPEARKKTGTS
ncbi:MAG: trehalose-phosphatase [Gemmatimonadota bacterium]|nr:trehalose-phosphatase [Gemmatimonadota bacterium]